MDEEEEVNESNMKRPYPVDEEPIGLHPLGIVFEMFI
jgi:hypothetical protein